MVAGRLGAMIHTLSAPPHLAPRSSSQKKQLPARQNRAGLIETREYGDRDAVIALNVTMEEADG
jgi:hypothetical protein